MFNKSEEAILEKRENACREGVGNDNETCQEEGLHVAATC